MPPGDPRRPSSGQLAAVSGHDESVDDALEGLFLIRLPVDDAERAACRRLLLKLRLDGYNAGRAAGKNAAVTSFGAMLRGIGRAWRAALTRAMGLDAGRLRDPTLEDLAWGWRACGNLYVASSDDLARLAEAAGLPLTPAPTSDVPETPRGG